MVALIRRRVLGTLVQLKMTEDMNTVNGNQSIRMMDLVELIVVLSRRKRKKAEMVDMGELLELEVIFLF